GRGRAEHVAENRARPLLRRQDLKPLPEGEPHALAQLGGPRRIEPRPRRARAGLEPLDVVSLLPEPGGGLPWSPEVLGKDAPAAGPQRVQRCVGHDPVHPGAKARPAVVALETAPRFEPGLLEHVLGIMKGAQHAVAEQCQLGGERLDQPPESLFAAARRGPDQGGLVRAAVSVPPMSSPAGERLYHGRAKPRGRARRWRRHRMKLYTHLLFGGNCEEAFRYYEKHLDGRITMIMRVKELPPGTPPPPGPPDAVIHARMNVAGTELIANDVPPAQFEPMRSAYVYLSVDSDAVADRIYAALSNGGKVGIPMSGTFFASRFAQLRDRFGTLWTIIHEAAR